MHVSRWAGLIGATLVWGVAAGLEAPAEPWRNPGMSSQDRSLAGHWKFNEKRSDDPREMFGGGGGMGPPPGGGIGGRGGFGGGGGRGGPGGASPGGRPGLDAAWQPLKEMELLVDDSTVTVRDPKGRGFLAFTDGSLSAYRLERGQRSEKLALDARWDGDRLVVMRQGPRGGTLTETFYRSEDGTQLYVDLLIDSDRLSEPIELRRVYDPAKPGS